MKIYCLQLDIEWENKTASHRRVERLLAGTPPEPGSLVILPEMFATGFTMNPGAIGEDIAGESSGFLSAQAQKFGVCIAGGVVTTTPGGRGQNQCLAFSPEGREIARYTKLQPFTPGGEADHYAPGDRIVVFPWQGLLVSPFLCYDLRFPEHFRSAVSAGAQLFIVCANWPLSRIRHWTTLLQARAIENQAFVAGVNRTGTDPKLAYNGRSLIVSPQGAILADAGNGECVISADLSLEELLAYRAEFPFLADRRPLSLAGGSSPGGE